MNRTHLTLAGIALFFALTSEKCDKATADTSGTNAMTSIIGTRWNLATLAGKAIQLPEGVENPYIALAEDNSLSGFGGCNRLMGSAKLDGGSISFPGLGSTKKFCESSQAVETSFLTALRATNSFRMDGDKLTLLDKSKELATLVKGQ